MKLHAFILSVLLLLSMLAVGLSFGTGVAAANGSADLTASDLPGDGSSSNPYQISNASELQAIEDDLGAHYELVSDINASGTSEWNEGAGFAPIGNWSYPFTGTFDGNSQEINNLTINRSEEDYAALFGSIEDSIVTGVKFKNADITGNERVGVLIGYTHDGTISEVTASGTVQGNSKVGGIIGEHSDGELIASNSTVTPEGRDDYTGGLVGYNDAFVNTSFATGAVEGSEDVGGLIGRNLGTVNTSYATGSVTGTSMVGGLVGSVYGGTQTRSYATGTVSGDSNVGSLIGYFDSGMTSNAYWDVNTTGQSSSAGGTGLTTAEMTGTGADSNLVGFDFTTTWDTNAVDTANGYVLPYPTLTDNTQNPAPSQTLYAGGAGTGSDPYEIATWTHLNNTRQNLGANFTLVADLNKSTTGYDSVANGSANGGAGFDPIGDSGTKFTGTFDGNSYTIADLTIDRADEENVGLFGYVGSTGVITNTSLEAASVTGYSWVGPVIGSNDGTVNETYAIGLAESEENDVGGVVGWNGGMVEDTYATTNVTGPTTAASGVGVGGLVGENVGTVNASYATGNVSTDDGHVGGLVGYSEGGEVNDAYWDVNTTGQDTSAGGTGLTTSQLKANTSLAGFDFTNTWDVVDNSTYISYPYLLNNTQSPAPGLATTKSGSGDLYAGGSGTESDPYEIANWTHLNNTRENLGSNFILVNDLNETTGGYESVANTSANGGNGFDPIGTFDSSTDTEFNGTFDGNGHTIENLTISRSTADFVGLFGAVESGGILTNINLKAIDVSGNQIVGGLAGTNYGKVNQSDAAGDVEGDVYVGGLVGRNKGTVNISYSTGNVFGSGGEVGGLVGKNDATVNTSYATNDVETSSDNVGGLVGNNGGSVDQSYATGNVVGSSAGGLVGKNNYGKVTNSFWDNQTTDQSTGIGTNVGDNTNTNVEERDTTDMMTQATFTNAGWEFSNTWSVVDNGTHISYPYLLNNTQSPAPGLATTESGSGDLYAGGSGIESDPYEIANWTHLNNTRKNLDANFTLVADLDENTDGYGEVANASANNDKGFDPFGDRGASFSGTFDGQDHSIANLTINRTDRDYVALFGRTDGGMIVNVSLEDVEVTGDKQVGSLVGSHGGGVVSTSSATGTVDGSTSVGGLVGDSQGRVSHSTAAVSVTGSKKVGGLVGQSLGYSTSQGVVNTSHATGTVDGTSYVGGLVGRNDDSGGVPTVKTSYATGSINGSSYVGGLIGGNSGETKTSNASGTVTGSESVGGLVGANGVESEGTSGGSIESSNASGEVAHNAKVRAGDKMGGLVGQLYGGSVTSSNATGDISGGFQSQGKNIGGLVGYADGMTSTATITDSYAAGDALGDKRVGGLVGTAIQTKINRTYATGGATGTQSNIGGLVGNATGTNTRVSNSYAVGSVTGNSPVGGLIGTSENGASVIDAYWDVNTTRKDTSDGGTVLTTSQLKGNTSLDGFDFGTTWAVKTGDEVSYPYLLNNTQSPAPGLGSLFAGGDGTEADPYELSSPDALGSVSSAPNASYELTADLNMAGVSHDPIGTAAMPFNGSFDGNSYTIANLTIDRPEEDNVGLFGYVETNGTVANVTIEDATVTGDSNVGGLVGENTGTITDSSVTGSVTGNESVGGLSGANGVESDDKAGGTIESSTTSATVIVNESATAPTQFGGLVGQNYQGTVTTSNATGDVQADDATSVGGLVGYTSGTGASAVLNVSYATGNVTGTERVGGVAGTVIDATVNQTYAIGSVTGDTEVGGLLGNATGIDTDVERSYVAGNVTGNSSVGGLVGATTDSPGVANSYWDVAATGQDESAELYGDTFGKTTAEMTGYSARAALTPFDIAPDGTWAVLDTDGQASYPILQASPQLPRPGTRTLYAAGDGTASNPYEIENWHHLNATRENPRANYTLVADLGSETAGYDSVASESANGGDGFAPIGTYRGFEGEFDGEGHTIANLTIDRPDEDSVGLFAVVPAGQYADGTVKNLRLSNVDITGGTLVGGVAGFHGQAVATIANVSVSGTVEGTDNVGGVVGTNLGLVEHLNTTATVNGSTNAGGLAGVNRGVVTESYSTATVNGSTNVGGLIGENRGIVNESYAVASVSGTDSVGALVGQVGASRTDAAVAAAYAAGSVEGDTNVGGLIGNVTDSWTVTDAYWDVNTTGQDTSPGSATGLTTSQLKANTTLAFDFDNTWNVRTAGEVSYPFLLNNTQVPAPGLETVDATTPEISAFSASNPSSQDVAINFNSDEQLATIRISISGAELASLSKSDFTETNNDDGSYTYEATYSGSNDGTYDVTLSTAEDSAGNGVSGQSDSVSISTSSPSPSPDPADFAVTIDSAPSAVTAGNSVTVEATVTNTGDNADTQDIMFSVNGTTVATRSDVDLTGGDSESLSFDYDTDSSDIGEVDIEIASDDDTATDTVTVSEPPAATFSITKLTAPDQVTAGETLTVEATIENTGGTDAQQQIEFLLNDSTADTNSLDLAAGTNETVEFTSSTQAADIGEVDIEIASDDDTATTSTTVVGEASIILGIDAGATTGSVVAGETATVVTTIENTGTVGTEEPLTLRANGNQTATENVSVGAGQTETASFDIQTRAEDTDDLNVTVAGSEQTVTTTIAVAEPGQPFVDVSITDSPDTIVTSETAFITVKAENTGQAAADQTVAFAIPNASTDVSQTEAVSLTPGESTTAVFSWNPTATDTGTHTATVTSNDTTATTNISVVPLEASSLELTLAETDVFVNQSTTATAQATFTNGSTETVTGSATLSSADESVATISDDGIISAVGGGTTIINASFEGLTATTTLIVTDAAPVPQSAVVTGDRPDLLEVTFDRSIQLNISSPNTAGLTAETDGQPVALDNAVASDKELILTLSEEVPADASVAVSYDGTSDNIENAAIAGVEATGFSEFNATNTVEFQPVEATIGASSYSVSPNTSVGLQATDSTVPEAQQASYEWQIDGTVIAETDDPQTITRLNETGSTTAEVTVDAGTAGSDTDQTTINVRDTTSPMARLTATEAINSSEDPNFDATASTDNVEIASYEWNFGDGTTTTGESLTTPDHTYDTPGRYDVRLTVTDTSGNTATNATTVLVEDPAAVVEADSLAFGSVGVSSSSATEVTVRNTGTAELTIADATLTGSDSDRYTSAATADGNVTIRPGDSQSVPVTFTPTSVGEQSDATLQLETNNPDPAKFTIDLSGSGIESNLTSVGSTADFGSVEVGEQATTDAGFENVGEVKTTITNASITGSDQFNVDTTSLPLPVTDTNSLPVTFSPTRDGEMTGTLTVTTSDGSTASLPLSGSGAGSDIRLASSQLSFTGTPLNTETTSRLQIENYGSAALDLTDLRLTGAGADQFSVTNTPQSIAPDGTGEVGVSFTPTESGTQQATLVIDSNDPDEPTREITVTGEGLGPEIDINKDTLNFPPATLTLTVTNQEGSPTDLRVDETPITGKHPQDFTITSGAGPFTLAPGESETITVQFNSTGSGDREAQLKMFSNAENQPFASVWLTNTESYILLEEVSNPTIGIEGANLQRGETHVLDASTPATIDEPMTITDVDLGIATDAGFEMRAEYTRSLDTASTQDASTQSVGTGSVETQSPPNLNLGPNREVVQHIDFATQNVPSDLFASQSIEFTVNRSQLTDGTTPDELQLHTIANGDWETVAQLSVVGESDSTYTYAISLSNFSEVTLTGPSSQVESLNLSVADTELQLQEETTATVTATFTDGSEETVTTAATIESLDQDIATVDAATVTGGATGTAELSAQYTAGGTTVSDTATVSVIDQEAPFFDIITANAEASSAQADGEVNVTVANIGGSYAEQTVSLGVNGSSVDTTTVTLAPNGSRLLTLKWPASELTSGDNTAVVQTADTSKTVTTNIDASEENPDSGDDSDGDDGDDGGGSGGSGSSGSSGGSPTTSVTTDISDAAPDTAGTTVEFRLGVVEAVTFTGHVTSGQISVEGYVARSPPDSPATGDRPVLAGAAITVPEAVTSDPATIRMTVDQSDMLRAGLTADDLAILQATNSGYRQLETAVVADTGDVTIEADPSEFSRFIVSSNDGDIGLDAGGAAATATPDDETPPDAGEADDAPPVDTSTDTGTATDTGTGTETPAEGTPTEPPSVDRSIEGIALIGTALLALIAVTILATRRNTKD